MAVQQFLSVLFNVSPLFMGWFHKVLDAYTLSISHRKKQAERKVTYFIGLEMLHKYQIAY